MLTLSPLCLPQGDAEDYSFEGGITTHVLSRSDRTFFFRVTMNLTHPRLVALTGQKPPLHFHPYQAEYIEVETGILAVEMEGQERLLTADSGEVCVPAWTHHRLYPPSSAAPKDPEAPKVTTFLLSGGDTPESLVLDNVFFENWYAYQDEVVVKGRKVNLIQVMSVCVCLPSPEYQALLTECRCSTQGAHISHCRGGFRSVAASREA